MPRDDVPAAHSMDTSWFAVDAEGRVGLFDTGEDGALPTKAANLGGPSEPSFDSLVFHAAILAKVRGATWEKRPAPAAKEATRLLVVKHPPGLDPAVFEEISKGPPWVGLSRKPLRPSKLEGLGDFTCVLTEHEIYDAGPVDDERPAGVFAFTRDHGDDPGRYTRFEASGTPLLVDALPPSARDAIAALRLPVDFTTAQTVHLGDHLADADAAYYGDWTLRGFGDDAAAVAGKPSVRPRATLWPWGLLVLGVLLATLLLRRGH